MVAPLTLCVPFNPSESKIAREMEAELNHIMRHHNFVKGAYATGSHDWDHDHSLLGEDGKTLAEVEDKIEKVKQQLRDMRKQEQYLESLRARMKEADVTKVGLKKKLQHVGDGLDAASSSSAADLSAEIAPAKASKSSKAVPHPVGTGAPAIVHLEDDVDKLPKSMGAASQAVAPQVLKKHPDKSVGTTIHFQDSAAPAQPAVSHHISAVHEKIKFAPESDEKAQAHVPQGTGEVNFAAKNGGGGPHAPQVVMSSGEGVAFHASQTAAADKSPAVAHAAQVVIPNSDVKFVSPPASQRAKKPVPLGSVGHPMNIHASTALRHHSIPHVHNSLQAGVPIKIGGSTSAGQKGLEGVPIKTSTKSQGAGALADKVLKELKASGNKQVLHTHELEQLEQAKSGALQNYRNYAGVSFDDSAPASGGVADRQAEASTHDTGVVLGSAPGSESQLGPEPRSSGVTLESAPSVSNLDQAANPTQLADTAGSAGIEFGNDAPSVGNALDEASKLTNMIGGETPGLPRMDV
jgi:hypothetical protein